MSDDLPPSPAPRRIPQLIWVGLAVIIVLAFIAAVGFMSRS